MDGPAKIARTEWYPMPVLRYFFFVGGALLALLFVCDAMFPQVPLPATLKSGSDLPAVRIQSARKWPERVVMDTTLPAFAPVQVAKVEAPKLDALKADIAQQGSTVAGQQTKMRDAFAQMGTQPKSQIAPSAKVADSGVTKAGEPAALNVADAVATKPVDFKSAEVMPEPKKQPKRKVAKVHPSRPMILVAQQPQPHGGWFDSTW
jgi:hypothetical protein